MPTPPFLAACRREPTPHTPVWFMRQAGRYMAEYRAIRSGRSFLEVSRTPKLTAEVTMQPINAFDLDAAIIFADIMTPLDGIGIDFGIEKGVGPVIEQPIDSLAELERVQTFDPGKVGYLTEALSMVRKELPEEIALIGFAGAPFTMACYMIQGRSSRDFAGARTVMHRDKEFWHGLMAKLAEMTTEYLRAQIRAGAQAVQVFDSWVGQLGPRDYAEKVQPYMKAIFDGLRDEGVPMIHFGTGTVSLLELMKEAGGDVIGLDWRVDLRKQWDRLGPGVAVQGNLDPTVLLTDEDTIERHVRAILDEAAGQPGHIFNVGHGIHRTTQPSKVEFTANLVHSLSKRG